MDWLSTAVSKLQHTIAESTEEFLAEQRKYCAQDGIAAPAAAAEGGGDRLLRLAESLLHQKDNLGLSILNPLADDDSAGAAGSQAPVVDEAGVLPWERPHLDESQVRRMLQLSREHLAFLTMPPEGADFDFDLSKSTALILRLLQADPQIERWRFLLVPKRCAAPRGGGDCGARGGGTEVTCCWAQDFRGELLPQLLLSAGAYCLWRPPCDGLGARCSLGDRPLGGKGADTLRRLGGRVSRLRGGTVCRILRSDLK